MWQHRCAFDMQHDITGFLAALTAVCMESHTFLDVGQTLQVRDKPLHPTAQVCILQTE
jgi:hypothetical protein